MSTVRISKASKAIRHISTTLSVLVLAASSINGVALATDAAWVPPQTTATFTLNRLAENPRRYSLVISDDEERTASGSFSIEQLEVLRAVMNEADKFCFTTDAVGTKESVTTRFMDKREDAFIVDVEKISTESNVYFTLSTELGFMTFKAGHVIRPTRREEGFFFDLLSRLETVLPKPK
ncbi:MAG TPA: hypothetical protein VKM94_09095 [Blastocatellia bacterium]|nr:hypothetical protein [Blastocatellia bacterium]